MVVIEQQVAAPPERAPVSCRVTDELAARIAARLTDELAGDKFAPRTAPKLGLTIDLVLRRTGFRKAFVVIVLRAPDSYGGLGMGTPPIARAITDHVGGGTVAIVYVGSQLGSRVDRLEAGLFKEEIAVRGIFVVDAATGAITTAAPQAAEATHLILDKIGRAVAQAVEPAT